MTTASRWSIDGVLRQLRGARNAIGRAQIRHGRRDDVRAALERAKALANELEAVLLDARRRVGHGRRERRAA